MFEFENQTKPESNQTQTMQLQQTQALHAGFVDRQCRKSVAMFLLHKLSDSGCPGPLLQQQQTKMLEKVNINFHFGHLCL